MFLINEARIWFLKKLSRHFLLFSPGTIFFILPCFSNSTDSFCEKATSFPAFLLADDGPVCHNRSALVTNPGVSNIG